MGKMVEENLQSIINVTIRYCQSGEDFRDFIGGAVIECLRSEKRFKKKMKTKFMTYVSKRILGTVIFQRHEDEGYRRNTINKVRKFRSLFPDKDPNMPEKEAVEVETPEDKLIQMEVEEAVSRHVGKLETKQKIVIWLLYFKDFEQQEIAEKIGLSEGRISQIKSLAIKELRKTPLKYIWED